MYVTAPLLFFTIRSSRSSPRLTRTSLQRMKQINRFAPEPPPLICRKSHALSQAVYHDVESRISNTGYITGYVGGIIMTLIAVAIAFLNAADSTATQREKDDASNRSGRVVLCIVGFWWFCFSLFTFFRLSDYPGPALPSIRAYITRPWVRLLETFRHIRQLPNLGRFLLLYFFFSDGYSCIGSLGVLFALNEIGVPTVYLVLLLVETQVCSLVGVFLFEKFSQALQNRRGCSPSRACIIVIATNLIIIGMLPIYAVIGLSDSISWGLKSTGEIFIFGGIYGLMIGAVQSFSRSLFASMIPHGLECAFFGLYEITDKGSSWIAPLIASAVMAATRQTCGWKSGNPWHVRQSLFAH